MRSIKKNCSSNEATWNGVSEGKGRFPYFNTGEKKKNHNIKTAQRERLVFSPLSPSKYIHPNNTAYNMTCVVRWSILATVFV